MTANNTADRIWAQNELTAARRSLKDYETALKRSDLTTDQRDWLSREVAHIRHIRLPAVTAQMQAAGF